LRPAVSAILDALLRRHGPGERVDLNDIGEVIGPRAVTYDEVDELVGALEARGRRVADLLDERDVATMKRVVAAARSLAAQLGRTPAAAEVASACGEAEHVVRRALEAAARARRAGGP
jgi:hypothetical protein